MVVDVRITNASSNPITLPVIDGANKRTYLTINVSHSSGTPITFLSDADLPPGGAVADTTQTLLPGQFVDVLTGFNEDGAGFNGL